MCGIVGYVGNKNVIDVLINGLEALEYRGYDSSGIALLSGEDYKVIKSVGKILNLKEAIKDKKFDKINMGIAHTRWATHGEVNEINCHPHTVNNVTLVHNGIIENYKELKTMLERKGYVFKSNTDTEVACALIDSFYENDPIEAIEKAIKEIRGSYAFLLMFKKDKENLYAVRKDSPLIVGIGKNENFVASSISALLKYTKKHFFLNENEIVKVNKKETLTYFEGNLIEKEIEYAEWNVEEAEKQGFDHYMIKEINDQIELLDKINSKYLNDLEFSDDVVDLSKYNRIDIVACGSAYYAGLVGKHLMEQHAACKDGKLFISSDVASEYRYKKRYYDNKTIVIVISQSGETADTLASLRMANKEGVDTLAIVNVPSSTIAREAKYVMPMLAGPEICVATTKGYFSQVQILSLLALKLSEAKKGITSQERKKIIKELRGLKDKLTSVINNKKYITIANKIFDRDDIYFIGRGLDANIIIEASLKLKEISYIHSEAFQSGELKHGPIALIDKKTPLFALVTDKSLKEKSVSNIVEAKTRGAYVTIITTNKIKIDKNAYNNIIAIPSVHDFNQALIAIIPFQLLAYYIAKARGCDIDKPRNLAKSVTVE